MANNVVFFEIPADDPERIKDFYSRIFDWQIDRKEDTGYLHITTQKGLTGGFPSKSELPHPISETGRMNYISVDDVDEHCRLIEKAGEKGFDTRIMTRDLNIAQSVWVAYNYETAKMYLQRILDRADEIPEKPLISAGFIVAVCLFNLVVTKFRNSVR